MQEFQITLKNKNAKNYHLFAWLIAIIIYSIELYLTFSDSNKYNARFWIIAVLGGLLFLLVIIRGFKLLNWGKKEYIATAYGYIGVPLIIWHYYLLFLVLFIFVGLYVIAIRKLRIIVSEKKIVYPSFPSKKISWQTLNNCLLKDGLLTIDFKNNKIIQQLIDESKTSVDEKDFNEFCKVQIQKARISG